MLAPFGSGGRRRLLLALGIAVTLLIAATPVQADAPVQSHQSFTLSVENPNACPGFGVRWDISTDALIQSFYQDGVHVAGIIHVQEHNTLTNLASGATVADDPVYEEHARFATDGSYTFDVDGLWVNAGDGRDRVADVGRVSIVVVPGVSREWIFAAGQHPFREVAGEDLVAGLSLFCDLLS